MESLRGFSVPIEIKSLRGIVVLKQYSLTDVDDIFNLIDRNRDHLSQFTDRTSLKYNSRESVEKSIVSPKRKDKNKLRFAIRNETDELVGTINLRPDKKDPKKAEIGYYLGREFTYKATGKNYIDDAVGLLSHFAFKHLNLTELTAEVDQGNTASEKVLLRCGFSEIKNSKESVVFRLTKSEFS